MKSALDTTAGNGAVGLSGSAGTPGVPEDHSRNDRLRQRSPSARPRRKSFTITNTGGTQRHDHEVQAADRRRVRRHHARCPRARRSRPARRSPRRVAFTPSAPGAASGTLGDQRRRHDRPARSDVHRHRHACPRPRRRLVAQRRRDDPTPACSQTTGRRSDQAGSAFFDNAARQSRHLIVAFDADDRRRRHGGADGQTLVFADATKASADRARANTAAASASPASPASPSRSTRTRTPSTRPTTSSGSRRQRTARPTAALARDLDRDPGLRTATRHVKVETSTTARSASRSTARSTSRRR